MKTNFLILAVLFTGLSQFSYGQEIFKKLFDEKYDSLYYDKLEDKLTVKYFSDRKFYDFELTDNYIEKTIDYKSNPRYSLGAGGTYKWLGLNIAVGLPNKADSVLGNTQRIDLQTQINLRKLTINLYTGRYNGFYINNSQELLYNGNPHKFYVRPDIKSQSYGLSTYYVFNSSKYSNRATFLHNEWQKKSAGSFLAGGTMFYSRVAADSSLIPANIVYDTIFNSTNFDQTGYFAMGGNLGVAYTFVLWKHWFFDVTLLGGLSTGIASIYPENSDKRQDFKVGLTVLSKLGMGYNSENLYVGLNTSNLLAISPLPLENTNMGIRVGVIRFLIAYRFTVDKNNTSLPQWLPFKL
ncbi:MAG: DUF4421 family protein [Salinivirgaceae bacterium]|nr:DUF4421 family protein [Salinivirgaceae bacterium]